MPRTLKVAVAGLGPAGQATVRAVLQTPGLKLVAVVDPATAYAGKDLGACSACRASCGSRSRAGRSASSRRRGPTWCSSARPRCCATSSRCCCSLVARRMHVITTCEELAYPIPARAAELRELDRLARSKKVSLLATGINPGFAMDALPLALTGPCARVRRVSVTRVVDAASRSLALQRRVGAGLNLAQFRRAVSEGAVRHVGLRAVGAHDRGRARLEARPRRRDARARDRAARPRHRVPAHRGGRRRRGSGSPSAPTATASWP